MKRKTTKRKQPKSATKTKPESEQKTEPGAKTNHDNLEQLLKNLKLRKMLQVLDRELQRAEKLHPSYSEFLSRLLREQYHHQPSVPHQTS